MSPEEAKRELQRIVEAEQVDLLEYIGWREEVRDTGPAPLGENALLVAEPMMDLVVNFYEETDMEMQAPMLHEGLYSTFC